MYFVDYANFYVTPPLPLALSILKRKTLLSFFSSPFRTSLSLSKNYRAWFAAAEHIFDSASRNIFYSHFLCRYFSDARLELAINEIWQPILLNRPLVTDSNKCCQTVPTSARISFRNPSSSYVTFRATHGSEQRCRDRELGRMIVVYGCDTPP
jgi:hypothetical protein